jgi:hypothetical protein
MKNGREINETDFWHLTGGNTEHDKLMLAWRCCEEQWIVR